MIRKYALRCTCLALIFCVCLVMMPVGVYAEETDGTQTEEQVSEEQGTDVSGESGEQAVSETGSEDSGEQAGTETGSEGSGEQTGTETGSSDDQVTDGETTEGETVEVTDPEEVIEEEEEAEPVLKTSFKWGGYKLKFKSASVLTEEPLESSKAPRFLKVKGYKTSMKVSWTKPSNTDVDGYIILRGSAANKTYTEVAKVSASTKSYTDKKAKKKNTGYFYTVVSYSKVDGNYSISPCADWAAGVTSKSKLKTGTSATINRTTAKRQVGGKVTLTLKYSNAKKIYNAKSFRWYSDNEDVATVSAGKVTTKAPGTAVIRGRLSSGTEYKCTVTVVGAYTPGAPALEVDYASTDTIALCWDTVKYATSYDLYRSENGTDFAGPINVSGTEYTDEGLTAEQEYSYYLLARNDNHGYTALSSQSEVLSQQAVKAPRKTRVTGFPSEASPKARTHYTVTVTVNVPDGRTANIQRLEKEKWVTKSTVTLPEGTEASDVEITFPDKWWRMTTDSWRLEIPASENAKAYTSGTLVITPQRYYQNPKGYVQITNKISKHGLKYYTSPVLVDNCSTRKDHVDAMIKTAYKYKGDRYANRWSRAPGKGVDCSGLVMQACYGAGVDLWPSNPYRHRYGAAKYEWESRFIAKKSNLKTVSYKNRKRGDLIFFANSRGTVIHVAIYLGNNKIIHSTTVGGHVVVTGMGGGKYGHVCKVKRVFVS